MVVRHSFRFFPATILLLFFHVVAPARAHEEKVHQAITTKAVEYLISKQPNLKACGRTEVITALNKGVEAEDKFVLNGTGYFLFHFSPPLQDEIVNPPLRIVSDCDSLTWGFGNFLCSSTITPISTPEGALTLSANNFARYSNLRNALMSRGGPAKDSALVMLGHFLHLLQDLTSPAHVHNDAHPHFPIHADPPVGDPSRFEVHNFSRVQNGATIPMPRELKGFTDELSAFQELQKWTELRFHSEKTLLKVPPGSLGTPDANGYIKNGTDLVAKWLPEKSIYIIDDKVAESQFEKLAPEAVSYTASMIKLLHEKYQGEGISVCDEQLNVNIQGQGTVTILPALVTPWPVASVICQSSQSNCQNYFPAGKTITLKATGSGFQGWSGACSGNGDCVLVMDDDKTKNVTAIYGDGSCPEPISPELGYALTARKISLTAGKTYSLPEIICYKTPTLAGITLIYYRFNYSNETFQAPFSPTFVVFGTCMQKLYFDPGYDCTDQPWEKSNITVSSSPFVTHLVLGVFAVGEYKYECPPGFDGPFCASWSGGRQVLSWPIVQP